MRILWNSSGVARHFVSSIKHFSQDKQPAIDPDEILDVAIQFELPSDHGVIPTGQKTGESRPETRLSRVSYSYPVPLGAA
jgi:hypothetical protein